METQISTDVQAAAKLLKEGKVIAIPTETVYGLAANALSTEAVEEIFRLKGRPSWDPLIVHVTGLEALEDLEIEPPLWAERLMRLFWPGPLTILLPKSSKIPDVVTAGLPRVALRAPAHPITRALLELLPFPLAAPSANPFGHTSPTTPQHVYGYFAGKIPLILDGGSCPAGVESTIIGQEEGRFFLYRPGALPREVIEEALGEKLFSRTTTTSDRPLTPGQYPRHYAPRKPVLYGWRHLPVESRASLIYLSPPPFPIQHPHLHILSHTGDLREAAARLYATLHQCDAEPTDYILVERIPFTNGISETLHDRLRRTNALSLFTIGHSNQSLQAFLSLLRRYEVGALIDIRRQPYSKFVPHFSQGPLQKALHEAGIAYEWQPNSHRLPTVAEKLLIEHLHVALLCAEGEPARCHRFRLSDELTQKGFVIFHILPEGQLELHRAPISLPFQESA